MKSTGAFPPSNVRAADAKPAAAGHAGLPPVTWDHIISPDESVEVIGKLAAYPEVKAYKAGRSYRGRDISVLEITSPTPSEQVSLAKLTTCKPTIFITGRQHAYSDAETGEPSGSRRFGAGRGGNPAGESGGGGTGRFSINAWPQVTFFSGGTERPTSRHRASG